MDINSKVNILIKIYKKDRDAFEMILKKFVNYPSGKIESCITDKMVHNETKTALLFKIEIDLVALPYFLKEVKPLLNDGMGELIFYRTVKKLDTQLGTATLNKPVQVPTESHGWIMLIGVYEIESVGGIDYLLEKTVGEMKNIFGKNIFGFLGLSNL